MINQMYSQWGSTHQEVRIMGEAAMVRDLDIQV